MSDGPKTLADSDLPHGLRLLSWSWPDQRAYLPIAGYSDDGVFQECTYAVRDHIDDVVHLLRNGVIDPAAAAAVMECHIALERAMRHYAGIATAAAFRNHPDWQRIRELAACAAAACGDG